MCRRSSEPDLVQLADVVQNGIKHIILNRGRPIIIRSITLFVTIPSKRYLFIRFMTGPYLSSECSDKMQIKPISDLSY